MSLCLFDMLYLFYHFVFLNGVQSYRENLSFQIPVILNAAKAERRFSHQMGILYVILNRTK